MPGSKRLIMWISTLVLLALLVWGFMPKPLGVDVREVSVGQFSVTVTEEGRTKAFGSPTHVRVYARDFKDRLESVGFSVRTHDIVEDVGEELFRRYSLLEGEKVYACAKAMAE